MCVFWLAGKDKEAVGIGTHLALLKQRKKQIKKFEKKTKNLKKGLAFFFRLVYNTICRKRVNEACR